MIAVGLEGVKLFELLITYSNINAASNTSILGISFLGFENYVLYLQLFSTLKH